MSKIPIMDCVKGGCRSILDSIEDTDTKSLKKVSNSIGWIFLNIIYYVFFYTHHYFNTLLFYNM